MTDPPLLLVVRGRPTHIKLPEGPPDERFVYLSDVLPTAWQAVEYAGIPDGGSVAVLGLGLIGDMAARIALHRGHRVFGVDLVPERLERVRARGAEVFDLIEHDGNLADAIRDRTDGRGPDSVIHAVGMEAHGGGLGKLAQQGMTDPLPMLTIFDKQIQLRMGQANVKRWADDIMPLLMDGDPLGVEGFATHKLPLDEAPRGYEVFQKK